MATTAQQTNATTEEYTISNTQRPTLPRMTSREIKAAEQWFAEARRIQTEHCLSNCETVKLVLRALDSSLTNLLPPADALLDLEISYFNTLHPYNNPLWDYLEELSNWIYTSPTNMAERAITIHSLLIRANERDAQPIPESHIITGIQRATIRCLQQHEIDKIPLNVTWYQWLAKIQTLPIRQMPTYTNDVQNNDKLTYIHSNKNHSDYTNKYNKENNKRNYQLNGEQQTRSPFTSENKMWCNYHKNDRHSESNCWVLHPETRPEWASTPSQPTAPNDRYKYRNAPTPALLAKYFRPPNSA